LAGDYFSSVLHHPCWRVRLFDFCALRPFSDSRPAGGLLLSLSTPRAEARMKAFAAALIAAGFLYVADLGFNDGRYAEVIQRAITSVL
jgi:hypothetical protein